MAKIYLIGSLKEPRVREVATELRERGLDVFDDWHAPGADADVHWREYEMQRGHGYAQAIWGAHAQNVFHFDKKHLDEAHAVVLIASRKKLGGFSAGLELSYAWNARKIPTAILLDGDPEQWDVMTQLGTYTVLDEIEQLVNWLAGIAP